MNRLWNKLHSSLVDLASLSKHHQIIGNNRKRTKPQSAATAHTKIENMTCSELGHEVFPLQAANIPSWWLQFASAPLCVDPRHHQIGAFQIHPQTLRRLIGDLHLTSGSPVAVVTSPGHKLLPHPSCHNRIAKMGADCQGDFKLQLLPFPIQINYGEQANQHGESCWWRSMVHYW